MTKTEQLMNQLKDVALMFGYDIEDKMSLLCLVTILKTSKPDT